MCRDGNGNKTGKWISEISVSISMHIRSVSILRDGNWNEIRKQISEISESVFMRIRSVSILMHVAKVVDLVTRNSEQLSLIFLIFLRFIIDFVNSLKRV